MKWCRLIVIVALFASCRNRTSSGMGEARQLLGRYLFYDTRLSVNNTKSCASCHAQQFAFTDGYRTSITCLGEHVLHNAPSLVNANDQSFLDWANPNVRLPLEQNKRPLLGEHPVELGLHLHEDELYALFEKDSLYSALFPLAFPDLKKPICRSTIRFALSAFIRSIESGNSAYDRDQLSASAKEGMALFQSQKLQCASCHIPPAFTTNVRWASNTVVYTNTGLYSDEMNGLPQHEGIFEFTQRPADKGRFKIPSLRNVALTAPYMHDGSMNSLDEVIAFYSRGGHPMSTMKDARIKGFSITEEEKKALIDFLYSLTDSTVLTNPAWSDPFKKTE